MRRPFRILHVLSFALALVLVAGVGLAQNNQNAGNQNAGGNAGRNAGGNAGGIGNNSGTGGGFNGESMLEYYGRGYRTAVGGFSIDAAHVFQRADKQTVAALADEVRNHFAEIPADLDAPAPIRKVSLKRLGAVLRQSAEEKTAVPDAVLYLGGLTGIDYVVAVPEENDIYLAGPAEGWSVNDEGGIVGKTTGKPILLLGDLLTVLAAQNNPTPEVITCSIDPSPEAIVRLANLPPSHDVPSQEAAEREAIGMLNVSFTGIPANSRMASVLAAADYRMKTISLGFEEAPLDKFPSYFSMIERVSGNYGQRFWISPEYGTVYHDSNKLVWNLSDAKVKTFTEREHFNTDGSRRVSGRRDANAERWAQNMSKRYDELSRAVPIFAEAKNCIDLALVVAVMVAQNLPQKAGCSLESFSAPHWADVSLQQVPGDALCRVLNSRGDRVSVAGGIAINPWDAALHQTESKPQLDSFAQTIRFGGESWWSN